MNKALVLLLLILPYKAFSQFTIYGRVVNSNDSRPLANVSVFLNNATIGDKTKNDGSFILKNVNPGKYELIVSDVGFSGYSQSVVINNANLNVSEISISPKVISLNEVRVKPDDDNGRQQNFDVFKDEFLGISDLAKECKIINPELLDLNYNEATKTLSAKSVDFLIIENNALGYKIFYLLSDFILDKSDQGAQRFFYEGTVLFEEMKGSAIQEEQWKKRREEVYANSVTHFLRAAASNELAPEGFSVWRYLKNLERPSDSLINARIKLYTALKKDRQYRDSLSYWINKLKLPALLPKQAPALLTGEDFVQRTSSKGLYALGCSNDYLYVVYNMIHSASINSLSHLNDRDNTSGTLITFNAPSAFFNSNGSITNAGSLTYTGVWANKRLAELLPVNYKPPEKAAPVDIIFESKIDTALKKYAANHPVEKVYLHYDKPYYSAGDTLYFEGYVTDGFNKLSGVSQILDAELISPANKIIGLEKLKLIDGMAAGDFALDDTLTAGYYRLRAYTNLMCGAGEPDFFDQYLYIVNAPSPTPRPEKSRHSEVNYSETTINQRSTPVQRKIDVHFFPEGGNLVNGINSKIAFKATTPDGLGTEIKGTVTDEQGHQVAIFSSRHLGMGVIAMKPQAGKRYKANIIYGDSTLALDLPEAGDTGYLMNVDNGDPRSIRINIQLGMQNRQTLINLVAQSAGVVYYYASGRLVNNTFSVIIPKSDLPDGIIQITLFSVNGEPMNERLVFIRNRDQPNLTLTAGNTIYHARDKVKFTLTATGKDYKPVIGHFSVAVTDETRLPENEDDGSTILSHLLLTSEIKGYVEKPNYYFDRNDDKADADLDVLMLTQGYRWFEWKQVLNNSGKAQAFQPEKMARVTGSIKNLAGKPIPYGKVSLLSVTKTFFFLDAVADASGRFVFEHFPVSDSARYIIQATNKQVRKNTAIELDRTKPPGLSAGGNIPNVDRKETDNFSAYFNYSKRFHQEQINTGIVQHTIVLKEVSIKEQKEKIAVRHSANLNGPGNANDVITADQLSPGCLVFKDCIAGRLHGIQYTDGDFYYGFFPTLVLIDGIEVLGNLKFVNGRLTKTFGPSQADVLNSLNMNDVASIEILRDASLAAIYGVRGAGGVIIITMKTFGDVIQSESTFKPRFVYYSPLGYHKAKQFYSPVYDVSKPNTALTDLRTTIYWNPNITTDENGKGSFQIFNADNGGKYRVIVEGMDDKGHLGRAAYHYKVE